MELELHVAYRPPKLLVHTCSDHGARVKNIVIRLSTLGTRTRDLPYGDVLESMETPMLRLQDLLTVTLETPDANRHAELAGKLAQLHANGILCLRTCKEAQQVAQAAKQNSHDYSGDQGAISPLWYRDNVESKLQRKQWCVNILRIMPCLSNVPIGYLRIQVTAR